MCPNLSSPTISDVHEINQRKLFVNSQTSCAIKIGRAPQTGHLYICCATELIFKHTFLAYGANIFISFCMPCSGLDVVSSYWQVVSMIIMSVSDEGYSRISSCSLNSIQTFLLGENIIIGNVNSFQLLQHQHTHVSLFYHLTWYAICYLYNICDICYIVILTHYQCTLMIATSLVLYTIFFLNKGWKENLNTLNV